VRVIAGSAKGRSLYSVPGEGTRPITARVKAALFSIIGPDIRGASFLDLFAGTGAVGIEALSRGATQVVFIERAQKAALTVRRNLELTRLEQGAQVVHSDAFQYLAHAGPEVEFDYIYVAPPQYKDLWAKALYDLDERALLAPGGQVIIQIHPKEYTSPTLRNLTLVDERNYGSTMLQFYARQEDLDAEATEDPAEGEQP
jgi:16S rRNA (guanine(966)-N(2))-methyltransferase RsmD